MSKPLPNDLKLSDFKNAQYFGTLPPLKSNLSSSSFMDFNLQMNNLKGKTYAGELSRSNNKVQLKQINSSAVSLSIYDDGSFVFACYEDQFIEGPYFIFNPNFLNDHKNKEHSSTLCLYGSAHRSKPEGMNYISNIHGNVIKSNFTDGVIDGKCSISGQKSKKSKANYPQDQYSNSENPKIHAPLYIFQFAYGKLIHKGEHQESQEHKHFRKDVQDHQLNSKNTLKSASPNAQKFKGLDHQDQDANTEQMMEALQFLRVLLEKQKEEEKTASLGVPSFSFKVISINEKQTFVGFVSSSNTEEVNSNSFHGFGVLFLKQWPKQYGSFQSGKLSGLGRIYETEMNICQGLFHQGQLTQGFVVDHYNNCMNFGYGHHDHGTNAGTYTFPSQKRARSNQHHARQFMKCLHFDDINSCQIQEYKKYLHLKAFDFHNSYLAFPHKFNSMWPNIILNRLLNHKVIKTLFSNFLQNIEELQISQIEKIGQNSSNRIEKDLFYQIKMQEEEKNQGKSRRKVHQRSNQGYINLQIQSNLRADQQFDGQELKEFKEKVPLEEYIYQYKKMFQKKLNQHTKIAPLHLTPTKSTKKLPDQKSKTEIKETKINQIESLKFEDLISQYKICLESRKQLHVKQRKQSNENINTDKKQIKMKENEKGREQGLQQNSERVGLDLDKIYKQFLQL